MDWEDLKVSFFEKCIESIAWVFRLTASQHHKILCIKRYYGIAPVQSSVKSKKHSWWKYYLFAEVTPLNSCRGELPAVHGISQARILGWVVISFFRWCSWPRDQTRISCIGRQILYRWATREALCNDFMNMQFLLFPKFPQGPVLR